MQTKHYVGLLFKGCFSHWDVSAGQPQATFCAPHKTVALEFRNLGTQLTRLQSRLVPS